MRFSTTGANMVTRTKERARDPLLVPAREIIECCLILNTMVPVWSMHTNIDVSFIIFDRPPAARRHLSPCY